MNRTEARHVKKTSHHTTVMNNTQGQYSKKEHALSKANFSARFEKPQFHERSHTEASILKDTAAPRSVKGEWGKGEGSMFQNSAKRRRRRTLTNSPARIPRDESHEHHFPEKVIQIQTRPQNAFEDVTRRASSVLIALRMVGSDVRTRVRSVPEGALVLLGFLALAVFTATLILCAGESKENTHYEYHPDYHAMPTEVVHKQIEKFPDQVSHSMSRVPPGAHPNAPPRRSQSTASKSPDSSLNMSRTSIASSADSKSKEQPLLCQSLVVPKGMDLVFAIRSMLNQQRQELDFDILDLQGAPLCRVVVAERGERKAPCCGIFLQTLTRMPLAMVNTEEVFSGTGPPSVCRPNGSLFGVLKHDGSAGYTLKHTSGRRLLEFSGDFRRKIVNAVDNNGVRICVTEPNAQGYQIRIGPRVDAGMVICCLLGIDKLEGFALNDSSA